MLVLFAPTFVCSLLASLIVALPLSAVICRLSSVIYPRLSAGQNLRRRRFALIEDACQMDLLGLRPDLSARTCWGFARPSSVPSYHLSSLVCHPLAFLLFVLTEDICQVDLRVLRPDLFAGTWWGFAPAPSHGCDETLPRPSSFPFYHLSSLLCPLSAVICRLSSVIYPGLSAGQNLRRRHFVLTEHACQMDLLGLRADLFAQTCWGFAVRPDFRLFLPIICHHWSVIR